MSFIFAVLESTFDIGSKTTGNPFPSFRPSKINPTAQPTLWQGLPYLCHPTPASIDTHP